MSHLRTLPIKQLMDEVVATLRRPYGEDVIEDVFLAIEASPDWRRQYEELAEEFTPHVTNQRGGYWVKQAVGGVSIGQVDSRRSSLIGSYTKLRL